MWRRILEPPRLRIGEAGERHATWMELFFDLVFVVAISQLAERLAARPTVVGAIEFALLFVPVWWAWNGATFYADRFGTDDLIDRLFLLAQMAAGAVMAIAVGDAFGAEAVGFALSYAAFRYVLAARYALVRRYVRAAGRFASVHAQGFGLGATLWAVSVFVPPPERFIFWGVAMVADLATPVAAARLHAEVPPHPRHLPERFGLFTIIVLGDAIAEAVEALRDAPVDWLDGVSAILALGLAFSFWWVYFEGMDPIAVRAALRARRIAPYELWIYAHLPFTAAVTATGVGVRLAIMTESHVALPAADRWLLCSAAGVCFGSLGAIQVAQAAGAGRRRALAPTWPLWAATLASLLAGALGTRLTASGLVAILAALGALQVIRDLRGRARRAVTPGG